MAASTPMCGPRWSWPAPERTESPCSAAACRETPARERLAQAHRDLAAPLVAALAERGHADPVLTAELVDGVLGRAIDQLDAGRPAEDVVPATLEFVRRAIGITAAAKRSPR
jgi:hypothetical protein